MTYVLVTPPAVEPVSVAEIKAHARVDFADDDALLAAFGVAARQHFERQTNRSLISQSWRLDLRGVPYGPLRLAHGPVSAVTGIAYVDFAGVSQAWDPERWQSDLSGDVGLVAPQPGECWPCADPSAFASLSVSFDAGYGPAADDVPDLARLAIRMLAAHWYANREAVVIAAGTVSAIEVPSAAQMILDSYTVPLLR